MSREGMPSRDSLNGDSERLLRGIVEHIPHMIFVKDAQDLRFVLFNRAGEELLGVPRDQMLGKSDFDLFPRDQAQFFVTKDREVLSSGRLLDIPEEEILSPSKGMRVLHTKKVPILDGRGRPRYLLGMSEDITERKAAENERSELARQLQEAQKMEAVGRLAGGIAHDFNNLLTVIMGSGQLLLEELGRDRPERRDIEDIVKSAQRAAELTRQLLAFSRRQVLEPRVLDVNAVVGNIERLLRRLIGEDINLLTVLARNAGLVRADPGQLEQVIANLAVNARDAMPNGGTLTIATANVTLDEAFVREHSDAGPGPHVMLSVSDTGAGMSADVKARLFEPFFTTKESGKGTGLGLSTVYGIVRQSGGSISVESGLGRGTTFRILLPRVLDAEASAPGDTSHPGTLRGTETVLVAEDSQPVRQLAVRVLQGYGYTVLSAPDRDSAVRLAAEHAGPIHLLVTDVIMPDGGGPALAARMTVARPHLRVLYVSGYTDDAIAHHGVLEPGIALLQKPFTPISLARKVREVLDRGRLPAAPSVT
jgi:PAS domain S-box-containing protein